MRLQVDLVPLVPMALQLRPALGQVMQLQVARVQAEEIVLALETETLIAMMMTMTTTMMTMTTTMMTMTTTIATRITTTTNI
jgi:hypothetical protein